MVTLPASPPIVPFTPPPTELNAVVPVVSSSVQWFVKSTVNCASAVRMPQSDSQAAVKIRAKTGARRIERRPRLGDRSDEDA